MLSLINIIIPIIILSFIIYWLYKIDNCVCASKIPEKKFLKEWFIIQIVVLVIIGTVDINMISNKLYLLLFIAVFVIFVIINIIMLIRLFIYIKKLRDLKCNCGILNVQNYIYYYLIIVFSFISLILYMLIVFGIFKAVLYSKKQQKNKEK